MRYRLLLLAALWFVPPVIAQQGEDLGADWPRWRGHDGRGGWQAPREAGDWSKGAPEPVWRRPIGPGYSGIAVAAGRLYTQDRVAGSEQERVLCLDAASGDPIWEFAYEAPYGDLDYGKGPRATPLVTGTHVFTLGAVGHLYCLDAKTGREVWRRDCARELGARQPMWGFAASPILHDDKLIVHLGAEDGCYVALDPETGEVIWRAGSDPCGYATPIIVPLANHQVLIGWTPENVLGVDAASGAVLWKIPYKVTYGVSIASPIAADGVAFVSGYWEGSKAIRLGPRPTDAKLAWQEQRELRGLMSQPLYRDGYVYLLDRQKGLVCFELETGRIIWTDEHQLTPSGRNPHASLVWASPDKILALNSNGELVLAKCTPEGFEELGRCSLVGETWAHPAFTRSHVFARDDHEVVCFRWRS